MQKPAPETRMPPKPGSRSPRKQAQAEAPPPQEMQATGQSKEANGYSIGVDHTMYGFTIHVPTIPVNANEREGTHSEVSWMS